MNVLHKQNTYKTLSSIIHDTQLEALLILKRFCKGTAQGIRWQYFLTATLKLVEDTLTEEEKNVIFVVKIITQS